MKTYIIPTNSPFLHKAKSLESSFREILSIYGIGSKILEDACLDGGIVGFSNDFENSLKNNTFNLSLIKSENLDVACIDDTTYKNLKIAQENSTGYEDINIYHYLDLLSSLDLIPKVQNLLKDFNASIYIDNDISQLRLNRHISNYDKIAKQIGLNLVKNNKMVYANPATLMRVNRDLALKIAGDIILDAIDSGVDMMIVSDMSSFIIFNEYVKDIEHLTSREIDIPILSISQLILMSFGVTSLDRLALGYHRLKPSFI